MKLVFCLNSRMKCDNLNFWEQNKGLSRCQNTTILQKEKEIDYMPIAKPPLDGYIHHNSREKVFFSITAKQLFPKQTI